MPAVAGPFDPLLIPYGDPRLTTWAIEQGRRLQAEQGQAAAPAAPPATPSAPRLRPHVRDAFWPADMPLLTFVHEATHAAVAHWLGLTVVSCVVEANGDGMTVVGCDQSNPLHLAFHAVAVLAPAAFLDRIGHPFDTVQSDLRRAEEDGAKYQRMTGRRLDGWGLAHATLRIPEVGARIMRLAHAMRFGVSFSQTDLDGLLGPAATGRPEPAAVATDPAEDLAVYAGA